MKKVYRYILLLVSAVFVVSCFQKEDSPLDFVTIDACFPEDTLSKVNVSEKTDQSGLALAWEKDDHLKVIGNTTEVYTISSIEGKRAVFTGKAVSGSVFDVVLSESDNYLERSYLGQVQENVSSTSHLQYDACLKGVRNYQSVKFTDSWASQNGGSLLQSGCVLLHFQMPVTSATVKKVSLKAPTPIFYTSNSASSVRNSTISLTFKNGKVGSDNQVRAYIMTSMQSISIAAGTQLHIIVESDKGTYVKAFTPGSVQIKPGKKNVIKINSKNWKMVEEYKDVTVMSYNVGWFHKHYSDLGHYSYPEVAQVINKFGADIVGLNETDNNGSRSGYVYQAKELASQLGSGWSYYFAKAGYDWYGNSIVASPEHKVVKQWDPVELPLLDSSEGRTMGVVEYEDVVLCVTHFDHKSLTARISSAAVVNGWVRDNYASSDKLIVLMGDLNCTPDESTITSLGLCWDMISTDRYTYPSSAATKCIDYIFVWRGNVDYQVLESKVVTSCEGVDLGLVTDHLPLYATIRYTVRHPENDIAYDTTQGVFDKLSDSVIYSEN